MIKYYNNRVILFTSTIALLNSFCFKNLSLMIILCIIEVLLLILAFSRREYIKYVCYYLIFLTFSMESGNFVGEESFYGFKNFRIAGLNLAVWMLLPIIFTSLSDLGWLRQRLNKILKSIINKLALFTGAGIIMGLIVYAVDDYGISSKEGGLRELVNSFYAYILPFLSIYAVTWALIKDNKLFLIKQYLFACIPATAIVFVACLLTGNYGNRMGLDSLQVSEVYFLLISSLILISYNQFNLSERIVIFISGLIIAVLSIIYNASGKILIIVMLIPLVWLYIKIKQGNPGEIIKYVFIIIIALIVIPQLDLTASQERNLVLESKMADVKGLVNIGAGSWLLQIPESPRMRVTEFMNVGYEYIIHPWYAIFGKGFGGCIKDNLGLFSTLDGAAFPEWQLELRAYKGLHESFNTFFLAGGIVGLYILFSLLTSFFKYMYRSPWLLFGGLWLLLFYGYHMNVSIFGIVSLVVGVLDVEHTRTSKLHASKSNV